MADKGGNRGRGWGQGRGRGQGRGQGRGSSQSQGDISADAIRIAERARNLERAAQDIQQMLGDIRVGTDGSASTQKPPKKQGNRVSKSVSNLSTQPRDQGKQNQTGPQKGFKPGNGGKGLGGSSHKGSIQQQKHKQNRGEPTFRESFQSPPKSGGQSRHNPHERNFPPHPHFQGPVPPYCQNQNPVQLKSHMPHGYQGSEYSTTQYGLQMDYSRVDGRQEYQSPPPSYDESNRHIGHGIGIYPIPPFVKTSPPYISTQIPAPRNSEEKQGKSRLTAEELVKALALLDGQWGTADTLSRHVQRDVGEVKEVVKSRNDIFSHMVNDNEMIIELVPKVSLCSDHLSESGCVSRDSCMDLHICKPFISGFCKSVSSCPLGHRLDTNHNSSVLSKLYLDLIDKRVLYNVIKKVFKGSVSPQICNFYNSKKGCKRDICGSLHICKEYLRGVGKCSLTNCTLSHDIFTENCKRQLRRCGISLNESPRDILLNLVSSLENQDDQSTSVSSSLKSKKAEKLNTKSDAFHDSKEKPPSEMDSDSDSSEHDDTAGKNKMGKAGDKDIKSRKKKATTCRSTDVCGDVAVPEICIFAVVDKCTNEKKGCRYLHAKSLFHWQVQKDNKWYNFRVYHSKALEKAYRDVSNASVQLMSLNPEKLETHEKEMLKVLETESWTADFKYMNIKGSSGSKVLKIRRVSTRSSALFDNPKSTVYQWYFIDNQGKWICFGEVDSMGKQEFVCPITCEEIEKQYLSDSSSSMIISNGRYKYKLDFQQMTQTNLETNKVREIRRRPSGLLYQKKVATGSDNTSRPAHWTPMAPNQTHALVPLDPNKPEYQEVSSRLRLTHPTANIQKIQRLQNPYLWCLLQQKKASLSQRYDENQMNMQKLFHGIDPQTLDTICKENIDWRQGSTTQQEYGKGTYFSNSAAVARGHCISDALGHFSMILADVIVGSMALGTPTLTCPPINTSTNTFFDTTVNDVHAPTIFVKYDKEEYYPEYFIEFY